MTQQFVETGTSNTTIDFRITSMTSRDEWLIVIEITDNYQEQFVQFLTNEEQETLTQRLAEVKAHYTMYNLTNIRTSTTRKPVDLEGWLKHLAETNPPKS